MPPRKSHKKSKLGCKRCKTRKIKCDEIRPACGGCIKHGVSCDFGGIQAPPSHVSNSSSIPEESLVRYTLPSPSYSAFSSQISLPTPYSTPSPQLSLCRRNSSPNRTISILPTISRLMELRLMHNYSTKTAATLAAGDSSPKSIQVWQVDVPALAMNHPCLMDALLAVSAIHLRTITPGDKTLRNASHALMASAIAQYSSTLSCGLNEQNAEAVFATSTMIAFQACASRIFMKEDHHLAPEDEGYTLPLQWFHSFQGVKAVVMASWQWIRESSIVIPIIACQPVLSLDLTSTGRKFFGSLLDNLDAVLEYEDTLRESTRHAYEHSVACLSWAHEKPSRWRILTFPAAVSKRFIDLIEERAPLALVIVASFFAMTRLIENEVWWVTGIAPSEVDGIYQLLPEECRPMMEWAVMVAHSQAPISDEVWGSSWYSDGKTEEITNGTVHEHIDDFLMKYNVAT